jgi:anti-anti-sigma factor
MKRPPRSEDAGEISMHDGLVIRVGHDGADPIVRLAGEIDIATVGQLESRLAHVHEPRVTLDFCGVAFFDSAAITALIRFQLSLRERSGRLTLYGLGPHQLRVFDLLGLLGLLDFFDRIVQH